MNTSRSSKSRPLRTLFFFLFHFSVEMVVFPIFFSHRNSFVRTIWTYWNNMRKGRKASCLLPVYHWFSCMNSKFRFHSASCNRIYTREIRFQFQFVVVVVWLREKKNQSKINFNTRDIEKVRHSTVTSNAVTFRRRDNIPQTFPLQMNVNCIEIEWKKIKRPTEADTQMQTKKYIQATKMGVDENA